MTDPFGVNHRTAGAQFTHQSLGQGRDGRYIVFLADSPSRRDDNLGLGQVNILRFGSFIADELQRSAAGSGQLLDCG